MVQKPAAGPAPVRKVGTPANWLVLGLSLAMAGRGTPAPRQPPPFCVSSLGQLGLAGADV